MAKLYKHNLVQQGMSYTPEEIARTLADNRVTKNAVKKWLKSGLPRIPGKHLLIHGRDLKKFLQDLNAKIPKADLEPNEFFCMSCKSACTPKGRNIAIRQNAMSIVAIGACPNSGKLIRKSFSIQQYSEIKKFFNIVDESSLYDSHPPRDTDTKSPQKPAQQLLSAFTNKGDSNAQN